MEIVSTITAIGDAALTPEDPLVILFGDDATESLRDVAVIQHFQDESAQAQLMLHAGDQLQIDDQTYQIARVGVLANRNLQTIGHVSLFFTPIPEQPLENALYLTPTTKPNISVGSKFTYRIN